MDFATACHLVGLVIGCLVCGLLGRMVHKFYSTILFKDRTVFTYFNMALVVCIQLVVQSRVSRLAGTLQWSEDITMSSVSLCPQNLESFSKEQIIVRLKV